MCLNKLEFCFIISSEEENLTLLICVFIVVVVFYFYSPHIYSFMSKYTKQKPIQKSSYLESFFVVVGKFKQKFEMTTRKNKVSIEYPTGGQHKSQTSQLINLRYTFD